MECEKVYFFSWEDKERGVGRQHKDIKTDELSLTKTTRNKPGQSYKSMGYQETADKTEHGD